MICYTILVYYTIPLYHNITVIPLYHNILRSLYWTSSVRRVRPIPLLTLSLLTLLDSSFPRNPLWTWECHPFELILCLSQTLPNPQCSATPGTAASLRSWRWWMPSSRTQHIQVIYLYLSLSLYIYIYICIHSYTTTCNPHNNVYIYIYIYICMYVYIYIYIYIYIHIHAIYV